VLGRAAILCLLGICIYATMARLFQVDEISEVKQLLIRRLRPSHKTSVTVSSGNSNPVAP
jgi:hypothetical protein